MNFTKKILNFFKYNVNKNNIEDSNDNPYNFKISKNEAFNIANRNENLKSDYCRTLRKKLTYLSFDKKKITLVNLNNKSYWKIQILSGETSGIDYDYENNTETLWDGFILKKDLKYLRCLIDVNTGEYIFYPNT